MEFDLSPLLRCSYANMLRLMLVPCFGTDVEPPEESIGMGGQHGIVACCNLQSANPRLTLLII